MPRPLPTREWLRAFGKAYCAHGRNGTAAVMALCPDMSRVNARAYAAKLLKHAEVQDAIQEATQAMAAKFDTSYERLMLEAARIAFLDPASLLDDDGHVRDIASMDEDARRAIAGMDVESRDSGEVVTKKIKISDKLAALQFIAKMQQMLIEKKEIKGEMTVSLAELLDEDLKPGTQEPEVDMFA